MRGVPAASMIPDDTTEEGNEDISKIFEEESTARDYGKGKVLEYRQSSPCPEPVGQDLRI